jgi:hypothetical protein
MRESTTGAAVYMNDFTLTNLFISIVTGGLTGALMTFLWTKYYER